MSDLSRAIFLDKPYRLSTVYTRVHCNNPPQCTECTLIRGQKSFKLSNSMTCNEFLAEKVCKILLHFHKLLFYLFWVQYGLYHRLWGTTVQSCPKCHTAKYKCESEDEQQEFLKQSRIRETKNLSTDADSSTAAKKLLSIFFLSFPAAAAKGLLKKK